MEYNSLTKRYSLLSCQKIRPLIFFTHTHYISYVMSSSDDDNIDLYDDSVNEKSKLAYWMDVTPLESFTTTETSQAEELGKFVTILHALLLAMLSLIPAEEVEEQGAKRMRREIVRPSY